MKILLIGEYSRLHNSLKEGLNTLNHEVAIKGLNDGFKEYNVDFKVSQKWNHGILKKLKVSLFKLTGFDIGSLLTYWEIKKNSHEFSGYDIVQLINENSFLCTPKYEIKILKILIKNNSKLFLLSSGDDYTNVKYNLEHPERKSVVNHYLIKKKNISTFTNISKFQKKGFKKLHHFIQNNINGVIATDLDYHKPLLNNKKYLGLIANPINIDKIKYLNLKNDSKIIIFLGINTDNYYKKGCDYFEKALKIIRKKYPKVEIISTRSLPYNEYIKLYNTAHILLDQAHAIDQGYNALEAMAKGKVVFTGAEEEFLNYYNLKQDEVAINAFPNVEYLVEKLSFLIENPEQINIIGKNANAFIKKEHDYVKISKHYLKVWNDY